MRGMLHAMVALLLVSLCPGAGRTTGLLTLPARPANAPTVTEFAALIASNTLAARETAVRDQVLAGNIPDFLRTLREVRLANAVEGRTRVLVCQVTPDYLAVGSDQDYLLMPLSPRTAEELATALGCTLPTRRLVDAIYDQAPVKLAPRPIPPSAAMTSVPVFAEHQRLIREQRDATLAAFPPGALTAGHKKDVVITPRLESAPGKVAIYGWHRSPGQPIQPLYLGHAESWVDYSQCIRLVSTNCLLDGQPTNIAAVLADPALCTLLSDEGPVRQDLYTKPISPPAAQNKPAEPPPAAVERVLAPGGREEENRRIVAEPGVTILINSPVDPAGPRKPVLLVLYALPNGNTIEWTMGRKRRPAEDWHFDIQQIAAQTRFLRETLTNRSVVVAYLYNDLKSWPAWRKRNGDALLPGLVERIKDIFQPRPVELVLNGHSGGGSFIFGYLNTGEQIPAEVTRIAFLDSNYAYDPALGHDRKLAAWLQGEPSRCLCVLAYDDASALLDGKPFVSAAGGTWGRSHAMQADLARQFTFNSRTNGLFERHDALDGRAQFILRQNPERKIYHTVLVQQNGFIHSMVSGTALENRGYEYFGPAAYERWIAPAP